MTIFFSPKGKGLFAAGLILLVVGYILLGQGPVNNPLSRTIAPIILVLDYCVLLPFSIIIGIREGKVSLTTNEAE